MSARRPLSRREHLSFCSSWQAPKQQSHRAGSAAMASDSSSECRCPRPPVKTSLEEDLDPMKNSYGVVIVSAAAAVETALLLAPVPIRGQLNEKDKAFKAKQIAKQFENNATVMTLYDRTGKQTGAAFGERGLYGETVLSPDGAGGALVK